MKRLSILLISRHTHIPEERMPTAVITTAPPASITTTTAIQHTSTQTVSVPTTLMTALVTTVARPLAPPQTMGLMYSRNSKMKHLLLRISQLMKPSTQ